jgi:hypothetical protein
MVCGFLLRYKDRLKVSACPSRSVEESERPALPAEEGLWAHLQTITEVKAEGPRKDPKRRSYSTFPPTH